jgi:hypothetical protein
LILQSNPQLIKKEDLIVDSVTQATPRNAIVETRLRTAFRLERVRGQWVIREVRLGNGPWYSLDDVSKVLQRSKVEETQQSLEKVALAIARYKEKNGSLPEFKDYVSLTDKLAPDYLEPLIRLDAWERPIIAYRLNATTIRLVSVGPDGKLGSDDDISLTRSY